MNEPHTGPRVPTRGEVYGTLTLLVALVLVVTGCALAFLYWLPGPADVGGRVTPATAGEPVCATLRVVNPDGSVSSSECSP